MARDLKNTGGSDGAGGKFIKILTREARFEMPDGAKNQAFSGYLERVDMEFRDADNANDLPARWNINLILTAALPGDPETGAQYNVSLSSHWSNPILPNMVNGIAGALEDPRWEDPFDRYIRIWLNLKEPAGKRAFCSALGFISKAKGDYLPNKYPWNEGLSKYEGVPSDMDEADLFWLGVAHGIVKITGGNVIVADKATIKLPDPIGVSILGAQAAAPAPVDTLVSKAKAFFDNALATGMAFPDAVAAVFKTLAAKNASAADRTSLSAYCTKRGSETGAMPFGHIDDTGTWIQPATQPSSRVEPTKEDDLPF